MSERKRNRSRWLWAIVALIVLGLGALVLVTTLNGTALLNPAATRARTPLPSAIALESTSTELPSPTETPPQTAKPSSLTQVASLPSRTPNRSDISLTATALTNAFLYSQTNEPALARITLWPKERRYPKGATQRLLVRAYYTDGSVRDVTRLAAFVENDKEVARVDEEGLVHIGTLTGQGVVVARYMGFVAHITPFIFF